MISRKHYRVNLQFSFSRCFVMFSSFILNKHVMLCYVMLRYVTLCHVMINFHTSTVCSLFIQLKAVIANATKHSRHVVTTAMVTQGKHLTLVNICRERNREEFSQLSNLMHTCGYSLRGWAGGQLSEVVIIAGQTILKSGNLCKVNTDLKQTLLRE